MSHRPLPLYRLAKEFGQESVPWSLDCSATSRMKTRFETLSPKVRSWGGDSSERAVVFLGPYPTFGGPVGEATVKTRKGGFQELLREFQEAFLAVKNTGLLPAPGLGVLKWPSVRG